MVRKGLFIVLEGIDGCGKSSQIKKLASYLYDRDKRNHVLVTREPTMLSPYGKKVRELLANQKDPKKDSSTFTKLYVKDREFHLKKMIVPMMRQGCIVISDRYKYSTFAYQLAQGEELKHLLQLHKRFLIPDLVFIIDISEEESIRRLNNSSKKREVFEKIKFLRAVRENYLKMKDIFPREKIVYINGERSKEEVFEEIKKEIDRIIK